MAFPSGQQDDLQFDDELVEMYFKDITPENDLQLRIMRTYAKAFDSLIGPASSRPSGPELLKMITDTHPVTELFSHDVLSNTSIAQKVRNFLEDQGLHPNPSLQRRDRIAVKLAHIIYPGQENEEIRNQARNLVQSYIDSLRSKPAGVHQHSNIPRQVAAPSASASSTLPVHSTPTGDTCSLY